MRLTLLLLLYALFLTSCKKYKPAEEAFFFKASSISVKTTPSQGSGSHKITDLHLYVNDQFMGSYPAGNTLPVMSKGKEVDIKLMAGIKNNGISETRVYWPFYETIQLDTFVPTGQTVQVPINFKYSSGVTFTWTENFDSGSGYSMVKSTISESDFSIATPAESFEGSSLKLTLPGNTYLTQVESAGSGFTLPKGSPNVYLELDYKCNEEFLIGLIDEALELRPALYLNPQANWNKVYITIANVVKNPA